ncbi:MAG: outer membrane protein assembly factor BamB family protein, partial [Planctomycetota bacterium]
MSKKLATVILLSICIAILHNGVVVAGVVEEAGRILKSTGVKVGLIVHLGCGDGRLTAALGANDSYLVHGLEGNPANVAKAREHIHGLGLYGKVSVERFRGKDLPYTDNLVNLLVSEGLGDIPMAEVLRVLVPDGVAYIKKEKDWVKTVKPRPKEIDEWTHFLHDASNNAVADDSVVGLPYHLQWVGGPVWARSHEHLASVSAVVSAGGRIFYIVDEGSIASVALPSKWFLVARDAFNGVLLWKRPIGPWEGHLRDFRTGPSELARRLVAVKDRVYVTLGYGKPVSGLDAATGETVKVHQETEGATEIICHDGVLFCVLGNIDPAKAAEAAKRYADMPSPRDKSILVIKAKTGKRLWKKSGVDTAQLMPTTLAVANGRVFFQNTKVLICLNVNSGNELWRTSRPISINRPAWSTPTLVVQDDVVLSADRKAPPQAEEGPLKWSVNWEGGKGKPGDLIAYSAKTGDELWNCRCYEGFHSPVDVFVAGGLVWTGDLYGERSAGFRAGRDLYTGEIKKRRPADKAFIKVGMLHHRCYRNKATNRYLLLGRAGIEFLDVASGKISANHWVRGSCQYGIMPGNGLIYAPQHSCACYIKAKLNGFNALASKRESRFSKQAGKGVDRLERGPGYGQQVVSKADSQDTWPTHRHDPARSSSTKSNIPTELDSLWGCDLGGKLSSVTIAEGRVFVVQIDTHTVYSLDAQDGKQIWSYTAGGRVDSPPTISKGLALFGSADGYVYCLRASDGEFVWRFRAARDNRRVVAYGQLESVWPVHGSVLVQEGTVYFAAGRSSFLDGGIYLYRLDLKTGKKLAETCINSRVPETDEEPQKSIKGFDMPG